ncbi:PPK2 family polyphosphate kinase [Nocardioides sp.]|uniref:PPK2 family polyphosphate kinase n=1 Tax=Nocardioides sp. TaxID=35761 RepID=UPI003528EC4C
MRSDVLRLPPGPVDLTTFDAASAAGFPEDKDQGKEALAGLGAELAELQEQLFAQRGADHARSVLLVLQGMDTSGKGGVLKHTVGLVDPQGVRITAFKAPTDEEKKHDFLWRIKKALPGPGKIGAFDRSHYEDVLIVRVHEWADADEIERRYGAINDFEADLVESDVKVVKCFLHITADTQKERLLARLDDPEKYWKFNPGDIDERSRWAQYREAYQIALERTNTEVAPWYLIPSDRKWLRNLAIGVLLRDTLRGMGLRWPEADFDIDEQRRRLETEAPIA